MITYSIIQKSQLEGAKRLDAEYYQPEYLDMKNKLLQYKNLTLLSQLVNIQTGPAYSSEKINTSFEISLARIGDITNKTEIENWFKLSKNEFEKFKNKKINNGDILMTMTGDPPDVGKVNLIINNQNRVLAFNQRVAKLNFSNKEINSKYLFAYLSTELARFQAERAALGIRQRNLGIEDLKNILVAIPNKNKSDKIAESIEGYLKELESSKFLYCQAENLLLQELNINKPDLENKLWCVVNLSEVKEARRIDAEFFQIKYKNLETKIKKHNAKRLGELVSVKKGIEPGAESYQDEGRQFIRVSSISKYGINENNQKYLSEDLYNQLRADFEPNRGEILLTKDASPGIAYVVKKDIEGIISSGILRLKLKNKNIKDEYLALCLNSIIGQMQAKRDAGGSIIKHWKPEQIKKVLIPILPKEKQQEITRLIRDSFDARWKAKQLLEEAKQKVEDLIENKSS